jgi:hypothetical protein
MSDLVEFRHLKYIVAVAEAANITRAAERLFLAQPSLSKQIKDLEDEIGFAFGHWVTNTDPAFLRILAKSERYNVRYDAGKQSVPLVEVSDAATR